MPKRHSAQVPLHEDPIWERGLQPFLFMLPEHIKFLLAANMGLLCLG